MLEDRIHTWDPKKPRSSFVGRDDVDGASHQYRREDADAELNSVQVQVAGVVGR